MTLDNIRELATHHQEESETAFRRATNLTQAGRGHEATVLTIRAEFHQRAYIRLTAMADAFSTLVQLTSTKS